MHKKKVPYNRSNYSGSAINYSFPIIKCGTLDVITDCITFDMIYAAVISLPRETSRFILNIMLSHVPTDSGDLASPPDYLN